MAAIVALPQLVEELLRQFGDVFPNAPARLHFAEHVTGLLVAEHKTVSGIAREFADAPDQSCLNRFLTESPWEPARLNAQRLEWLQQDAFLRKQPYTMTVLKPDWQKEPMATHQLAHGPPLSAVQETLGHSSPHTTAIYIPVAEKMHTRII